MAKYVLLSFDNDAEADAFTEYVVDAQYIHISGDTAIVKADVRAVYKKPTLYCDNSDKHRGKLAGWTRGRKYGWWVCAVCGKPTRAWADGEHWFAAIGKNLLPKTEVAPEYRGDGDYRNPTLEAAKTALNNTTGSVSNGEV